MTTGSVSAAAVACCCSNICRLSSRSAFSSEYSLFFSSTVLAMRPLTLWSQEDWGRCGCSSWSPLLMLTGSETGWSESELGVDSLAN